MAADVAYDPLRLLRTLHDGGVRFVAIGAFAGRLHGSPTMTRDLDICYDRDRENLESLATVLNGLQARLRVADQNLPFRLDARSLRAGDAFTFTTDAGDLDVLGTPSGTSGYDDLAAKAVPMEIDGVPVLVASVDDLIRMKLAAGRPKDLIEAEILGALREELAAYG